MAKEPGVLEHDWGKVEGRVGRLGRACAIVAWLAAAACGGRAELGVGGAGDRSGSANGGGATGGGANGGGATGSRQLNWNDVHWERDGLSSYVHSVWAGGSGEGWAIMMVSMGPGGPISKLLHRADGRWSERPENFWCSSLWGLSPNQVFAASSNQVFAYDGASWGAWHSLPAAQSLSSSLTGLSGTSMNDVWVAGAGGLQHWDGEGWTEHAKTGLYTIFARAADDVWHVSRTGTPEHWDGSGWSEQALTGVHVTGIWASGPDAAWAVTNEGVIARYEGPLAGWSTVDARGRAYARASGTLNAIWGNSADNVWAAGEHGSVLHWNGVAWLPLTDLTQGNMLAISGTEDEVWIAGSEVIRGRAAKL